MKQKLLAGCVLTALFAMSFALTAGEKVNYAELKTGVAPQWGNLKNVDIIPCPKEITLYDRNIVINENLAIVIGKNPSDLTKMAASDLQRLIFKQTSIKIPIVTYSPESRKNNLIILGTLAELPDLQKDCDNAKVSFTNVEGQGYAIFPANNGDSQKIILLGKDSQGVYWSAMTLLQLINDRTIRLAKVLDWPDFKNRVCETLLTPVNLLFMAKDETQKAKAWELIKAGVDEAARLKFNYIRCFAVLYSLPLTDYPLDKRAEVLGEVGKYVNARGMRLYLNISVAVATQGDEKQFPQLKDCARFLHLYVSWSDEELLSHACDKIARMAKIVGPQHYFLHSPDIPNMGWNSSSESDKKRWGDDRLSAEVYLTNRVYHALKHGMPGAEASYVSSPYGIGCTGNTLKYRNLLKVADELSRKLDNEIWLLWREGSLDSAQKLRMETKNEPQSYYIENSSFHCNRLVGGTARTAKTYYFKNGDKDFFYDNSNTSGWPVHKLQNYILAEYSWNTQAPGNLFVEQKFDEKYQRNVMTVNRENWLEWINVHDLDGAVRETLIPRACRQFFGRQAGGALALAYSAGSSINENKLGGPMTIPSSIRYQNSLDFAKRLATADIELAKLWDKPELFNPGSYEIYQAVYKYVFVFKYIEKINACLMKLNVIAEDGRDKEQLPALIEECSTYIKSARQELAAGYGKYHWDKVPFPAIYGASLGNLGDVNKKIDVLENAIAFKIKQIKMFGAGKIKEQKQTLLGIAPAPKGFKLDGKLDEWDMDTANILDAGFYNRKLGNQGLTGTKDIIAYWKTAWDKSYLYLAVMVFDNKLSFEKQSPLHENDSIELWINDEQLVFSFTPKGKIEVESYGNRTKDKIEVAGQIGDKPSPLHSDLKYYTAEIKIPIDYLKTTPEAGKSFYFALGVDDVDKGEKPSQIFFPETYKHPRLNPDAILSRDFATAVLQDDSNLTAEVLSSKISNVAQADGTYTCINLNLSMKSDKKTAGVSGEIYLYAKDCVHRFRLNIPNTIDGEWKSAVPLQLDTHDFYSDDVGVALIVRAPGFYKKFVLREGSYQSSERGRQSHLELFNRNGDSETNSDLNSKNELLYEISFDDGAFNLTGASKNKIASSQARGNTLVPGINGKAVKLDNQGFLEYPVNFKLPKQGLCK